MFSLNEVWRSPWILLVLFTVLIGGEREECAWPVPGRENETTIDTEKILEKLLDGYQSRIRPSVWKENRLDAPAEVCSIRLLVQGFKVDEQSQTFEIQGLLRLTWKDERLIHEEPSDGCISPVSHVLNIPMNQSQMIWRPEVFEVNGIPSESERGSEAIFLLPNGILSHDYQLDSTFQCNLRAKTLPWDTQQCRVELQSFKLPATDLLFSTDDDDLVFTQAFASNSSPFSRTQFSRYQKTESIQTQSANNDLVWSLTKYQTQSYISDIEAGYASTVIFEFDLERRPGYHATNSMMPALLFLIISYQGFFINRKNAPARTTLSVIPVLIMRLLLNNVYAQLETISYQVYLVQFLNICMWFSCACVIEYSFVQMALFREEKAAHRRAALNIMSNRLRGDTTSPAATTTQHSRDSPAMLTASALEEKENAQLKHGKKSDTSLAPPGVHDFDEKIKESTGDAALRSSTEQIHYINAHHKEDPYYEEILNTSECHSVPIHPQSHDLPLSTTDHDLAHEEEACITPTRLVLAPFPSQHNSDRAPSNSVQSIAQPPPEKLISPPPVPSIPEYESYKPEARRRSTFDPTFEHMLEESAHANSEANSSITNTGGHHAITIHLSQRGHYNRVSRSHTEKIKTENGHANGESNEFEPEGFNPVFQRDIKELRKVFDQADADRSGAVEGPEVSTILRRYGVYISSETAVATILNYYFFNKIPIPKKHNTVDLNFEQFVDLITNYDHYALGHDETSTFVSMPTSLQIDIVSAWIYVPLVAVVLIFHFLYWFYLS